MANGEPEKEYILYYHDGRVRRVRGKLSELQKQNVFKIEEAGPAFQPPGGLLAPGRFPKRDEAISKLGRVIVVEVHDDGDLTVRHENKLYVITTEGQVFEQVPEQSAHHSNPGAGGEPMAMPESTVVSPHCAAVLDRPISKEVCLDFREVRRRNMCRAWELMETEKIPFRTAIKRAWDETLDGCRKLGVYSPEPVEPEKAVELLGDSGTPVGTITLMKDGRVEFCHKDIGCDITRKPSPESFYLAQAFFVDAFDVKIRPLEMGG